MKQLLIMAAVFASAIGVYAQQQIEVTLYRPGRTNNCVLASSVVQLSDDSLWNWNTETNALSSKLEMNVEGTIRAIRKEGKITNLVARLVESGDVCAVIGHRFGDEKYGRPNGIVYYREDKHCTVCGKTVTVQAKVEE